MLQQTCTQPHQYLLQHQHETRDERVEKQNDETWTIFAVPSNLPFSRLMYESQLSSQPTSSTPPSFYFRAQKSASGLILLMQLSWHQIHGSNILEKGIMMQQEWPSHAPSDASIRAATVQRGATFFAACSKKWSAPEKDNKRASLDSPKTSLRRCATTTAKV